MSNDSLEASKQFQRLIMLKTPEERLRMGCSMFDTAKAMARSSILAQFPDISSGDMKKKIFLKFYGEEFSEVQRQKILNALD